MRDSYTYRKTVRRHHHLVFRRRALVALSILIVVGILVAAIFLDLHRNTKKPDISKVQTEKVSDNMSTFRSPYFQFRDTGKWVLDQNSTSQKFIYSKFQGLLPQHQLIVYVNQVPIPRFLAVSRVLPVRIVNGNSFNVTSVSSHCGSTYGPQEPHRVKTVSINEANMLCDPDMAQYTVILSQINGDYQLHLQRLDGTPVTLIITYLDGTLAPEPSTLLRLANSFQAL